MISETSALAERVRRLEQHNRVIKWIAAGILFLVIVAGLAVQQRPVRTIEAEKFVLLDSKGRARVTIATPQSSGVAIDLPETPFQEPVELRGPAHSEMDV